MGAGVGATGALAADPLPALLAPGEFGDAEFDDSGVAAGLLLHPPTANKMDMNDKGISRAIDVVRMKALL
jgi:hypothetical protein